MDFKEICLPIQHELSELQQVMKSQLVSQVPFVENVVEYVIQKAGKRLRPVITILSSKLAGYQGQASISIGASIEFMHTASLLHDDVLDNASLRRGRESANRKWGNHVSVLVGDFFFCRAMDILVKQGDMKILRIVTDAVTTTTEGEIIEIIKSNDTSITEEAYLQIITGKTAALMSAASQSGAILGQVSEDFEQSLKRFGLHIGIAFQLMDDVLDYTSNVEEFGKEQAIDLREGKLTLPLIYTIQRCQPPELQIIKNALIADEIDKRDLKSVLQIVETYDGVRDTIRLARSYVHKARENLSIFKPSLEKDTLLSIADYVLVRRN